jgi:inhibitor of cysteine peptidase
MACLGLHLCSCVIDGLLCGSERTAYEGARERGGARGPTCARYPRASDHGAACSPRGQEFEIRLQGNPTTGYGWQVTEIDAQKVQMLAEDYVEHKQGDQPIAGAGGTYIFRFKALTEGQAHIEIVYQRPWEKDVDPLRTYTLELTVR